MAPADDTYALATAVDDYLAELYAPHDHALDAAIADADAAGLPEIHVSAVEGKLLHVLARLVAPRLIVEVGTLGGYSTIWLARALAPGGRLISLELDAGHAAVARTNVERAGLADRVEVRVGAAAESLRAMVAAGEGPVDCVFIDADKDGYPEYLDLALQLSLPGTLILADNLIRGGAVLDAGATGAAGSIRGFNATVAADPRLVSIVVPVVRERLDGLGIFLVTDP